MNKITLIFTLFVSMTGFAQEKSPWAHESEASVVQVTGNTESESYSGKQKTTYVFDANSLVAAGRYLQTKSANVETAKSWEASLRYERAISEMFSLFVQHGAEADSYAGYTQRDNTDLGGKYFFIKSDAETFLSEAGYRYTKTLPSSNADVFYASYGRAYLEYTKKLNESVSGKLWVEYLPNFQEAEAYLVNYEGSLTVMMTQIFSLKTAYLTKFHNKTVAPTEKQEDRTLTLSIVAKF